ncbi:MAG: DNA repair protein RecN [Ignavibacteria bacterium RIFOXYB2_FULL_35_12]|nr:MAG: DNA repair protein RecN [Ignavibacteria bacterium GWA2_36_19]OGU57404.1 MAG: DNA repair protein RecN [Ignavibacteria bacterium GWF2_35_20]OGU88341.1 MAG: DNA repair protein RecN [Ignavibacteria bacterium RIFOXYC12_FULL_35_11]OGU91588.1 MAG: DNA repair protein RecN [Ignavibacteria bacterium RIFOXYA12_FULL_35_25]OGU97868.1 MAG: DNA repair protein RecN [Ignavibacteria bacterium RIFOXYB12_FULL_35_14]OGU98572.1 MAG: DNA repair protein RecN [Ignavibacteria bacterium RIFOXYC2_FULL_35_16]OGV0
MIKSLLIQDYALIEKIEVDFNVGLNIITGETGAGKSILIDAMSLLLGERASSDVIRKGADKSVVEGIFEVDKNRRVRTFLTENELEELPELIIRREISSKGSNRCFVNDSPVSLNIVKDLGDLLVDLHGQHEHQSLLRKETHINFLDGFGNNEELLRTYKWLYTSLNKLIAELNELKEKDSTHREKRDVLEFQIKEIDAVSPQVGEEEKLSSELNILENSEKLLSLSNRIYEELYESENSIQDKLGKIKNDLIELAKIDSLFDESNKECETALTLINDISDNIRKYKAKIEIEPEQVEAIRERLGTINLLKKKYGGSIEALLELRRKIGEEFHVADTYSQSIADLEKKIKAVRENASSAAEKLSKERISISKKVKKEIELILAELGIPNAKFEVRISQKELTLNDENSLRFNNKNFAYDSNGCDDVEFYISTNVGEDVKPLAKVASGGEVSRVMLALKSVLAKSDKLPLLIFDEIDSGISGNIAQKVGLSLKSLASFHQIIAITHLPQIAAFSDHHYAIEKKTVEDRVISSIRKLDDRGKVIEVAKLLSGEKVTDASIKSARELIELKIS